MRTSILLLYMAGFTALMPMACEEENQTGPQENQASTCLTPVDAIAEFLELDTGERQVSADVFLKLGDVKGDATDDRHKDEIIPISYSFGHFVEVNSEPEGRGFVLQNLVIRKYVDKASPTLRDANALRRIFPEVQFSIRKTAGEQQEEMRIIFRDVMISSISTPDITGDYTNPVEQIDFDLGSWAKAEGLDVTFNVVKHGTLNP